MADGLPSHLGKIGSESIEDEGVSQDDLSIRYEAGITNSAGEAKWVTFSNTYSAAPNVTITPAGSATIASTHAYLASVAAGSFSYVAEPSGIDFHWQAIGSA
jgi:hypothetical protein